MANLKGVLLLATVSCCIFASSCLNSEQSTSDVAGGAVSKDKAQVKINWGPVWDDNEGNNEFVARISKGNSEEDDKNCTAANGLGLENLFKEVKKILPNHQIKAIIKSYSEDPEIKALKAFLAKPQTQEKIKAIHNSKEYEILKDYCCRILHIDLIKYRKLSSVFVKPLLVRGGDAQAHKGIRGLLNDVLAVVPRQQIHELYKNLLASDDELVSAVANLKSKEFHQLISNVQNNVPEYKELKQQLIALGITVGEMVKIKENILGYGTELGLIL